MTSTNKSRSLGFSKADITEAIVDICSGALMLILFGPLLYALRYLLQQQSGPSYTDLLIGIFPDFFNLIKDASLATATPWIFLGLSVILGFLSRGVFILFNALPVKLLFQPLILWCAWRQIQTWHGLAEWDLAKIKSRLIKGNPFGKVGQRKYAQYRAALHDTTCELSRSAQYWDYEAYLFLRASHFYGLFFTFTHVYFLYGVSIFVYGLLLGPPFTVSDIGVWSGILLILLLVSIGLLQESIIHGVAFVTIDDLLYERFAELENDSQGQGAAK